MLKWISVPFLGISVDEQLYIFGIKYFQKRICVFSPNSHWTKLKNWAFPFLADIAFDTQLACQYFEENGAQQ